MVPPEIINPPRIIQYPSRSLQISGSVVCSEAYWTLSVSDEMRFLRLMLSPVDEEEDLELEPIEFSETTGNSIMFENDASRIVRIAGNQQGENFELVLSMSHDYSTLKGIFGEFVGVGYISDPNEMIPKFREIFPPADEQVVPELENNERMDEPPGNGEEVMPDLDS